MKSIMSISLYQILRLFSNEDFKWKVGNGSVIKFWEDHRVEEKSLSKKFQRLYHLCHFHELSIYEMSKVWVQHQEGQTHLWKRPLRAWEEEKVLSLNIIISNFHPIHSSDSVSWKVNNGQYHSSLGYKKLTEAPKILQKRWKWIWKCKVPHTIKVFYGN